MPQLWVLIDILKLNSLFSPHCPAECYVRMVVVSHHFIVDVVIDAQEGTHRSFPMLPCSVLWQWQSRSWQ